MKLGIIVFPGSGSAVELHDALELLAPGQVDYIDSQASDLSGYEAIFLPGGASFGDYLRPGALAAKEPIIQALKAVNEAKTPIFAVGNGFQILTEAGLLPGGFVENDSLTYDTQPCQIEIQASKAWFELPAGESLTLPQANRFGTYSIDADGLEELQANQQILARYSEIPQDQAASVAALTNSYGNVVAFMPRPERAVEALTGSTAGRVVFDAMRQALEQ